MENTASFRLTPEVSYNKPAELDKAKSDFFTNISHELRTPLTLIPSPLEAIRHNLPESADPKLRPTLDPMHANGLRLLGLMNDLLDLVRLEQGRLRLTLQPIVLNTSPRPCGCGPRRGGALLGGARA